MKKSKFTETQIVTILKQYEQVKKVSEIVREHGIAIDVRKIVIQLKSLR